jgi:hypothetical protein
MVITIETTTIDEVDVLFRLLKQLNIKNVKVKSEQKSVMSIIKGDKTISPNALFGIWENNPKSLDEVRAKAWKRDWNI